MHKKIHCKVKHEISNICVQYVDLAYNNSVQCDRNGYKIYFVLCNIFASIKDSKLKIGTVANFKVPIFPTVFTECDSTHVLEFRKKDVTS